MEVIEIVERLIGNLGFPIVMCVVLVKLLYAQTQVLTRLEKTLSVISQKLNTIYRMVEESED